ncbi:OmpW/AlkL family protein [Acinetobacter rongchengensis]|uniref:OmpW family protein n=1 Tax=Acinetobacter rongchengensis TaxID=2419601 RepID=A0A3A8EQT5_9GAMM|nr:OmpW family outer membrane protein [Acinetobacter rongchengensis]RKG36558.1 OmpW family protein [Acinetobacter rongchengensis]
MFKKAVLIALMGISSTSFAQWQVKVGASAIAPTQDTAILGGAAVVKADDEYAFTPSVEYIFGQTPFSAEVLLATPINHDVLLNGEKAVKLKHLPPTVTFKYNFKNSTGFTPYIGVGGTAFIAWDEETSGDLEGTKVKVKEDFGFAGQIGFNYQPADAKNWGVFVDARYAQISPEVEVKGVTTFDLDIDPMVYTIGYSYKF